MKIALYVIGGLIGLWLLYLILSRPVTPAYIAPSSTGGFWGGLGKLLGIGVASALTTANQKQGGTLVVERGYNGSGANAVGYMPNSNQSWEEARANSGGAGGVYDPNQGGKDDWLDQMRREGYSEAELEPYKF
jgi:hypothetical protein